MQVQDSAPRLLLVGHFRFLIKVPRAEPVSDRCALRPFTLRCWAVVWAVFLRGSRLRLEPASWAGRSRLRRIA